jgi:hypothetical protein
VQNTRWSLLSSADVELLPAASISGWRRPIKKDHKETLSTLPPRLAFFSLWGLDRITVNTCKVSPRGPLSPASTSSRTDDMEESCEGFSLLHLACRVADVGMVELLLQYGSTVNMTDSKGRTPLHHCILKGRHQHAKLLLSRYARTW